MARKRQQPWHERWRGGIRLGETAIVIGLWGGGLAAVDPVITAILLVAGLTIGIISVAADPARSRPLKTLFVIGLLVFFSGSGAVAWWRHRPTPPLVTAPANAHPPARLPLVDKKLSLRIGGVILGGFNYDDTRVQVEVSASNEGEPTTARQWTVTVHTPAGNYTTENTPGEELVKGSLEIGHLDQRLQSPIDTASETAGYVIFVIHHVPYSKIQSEALKPGSTIAVSAIDKFDRTISTVRSFADLYAERYEIRRADTATPVRSPRGAKRSSPRPTTEYNVSNSTAVDVGQSGGNATFQVQK